jgi:hypothetical protein
VIFYPIDLDVDTNNKVTSIDPAFIANMVSEGSALESPYNHYFFHVALVF